MAIGTISPILIATTKGDEMGLREPKNLEAGDSIPCFWCTAPMDIVERNGKLFVDHILECAVPDATAIKENLEEIKSIEEYN